MKFCVSYGSVKKEHIYIEFLKVAQECALISCFNTQEEIVQVMEFACQKFSIEVQSENASRKKAEEQKRGRSLSNSGGESNEESGDSDFLDDSSMYEKKMHIL